MKFKGRKKSESAFRKKARVRSKLFHSFAYGLVSGCVLIAVFGILSTLAT